MPLVGTNGREIKTRAPMATGPMAVAWAFIVGVHKAGHTSVVDHDSAHMVEAQRVATLDDMYGALNEIFMAGVKDLDIITPTEELPPEPFTCAFLVFSIDGNLGLSPNIFDDISPMGFPYALQVRQACAAAQAQIVAKHAARLAGLVATNQALATVGRIGADQAAAEQASAVTQAVNRSRNG